MAGLRSRAPPRARLLLEATCLAGHGTLFPDAAAEWQALRDEARRLAALGPAEAPEGTASEVAHAIAEWARAQALDLLGRSAEGDQVVTRLLWGTP